MKGRKVNEFPPEMVIKSVKFLKSSAELAQLPPAKFPEFAFVGRSNVGKSSLINRLVNHKNMAKTSSTPGKTQTINHFLVNENWYLADLPGYGFAKVSKSERTGFRKLMDGYLEKRETLQCAFLLVDSRITPQKNDLEMISFLGRKGIPFCITYTKIDGVKPMEKAKNIALMKEKLSEEWDELPPFMETSAEKGTGIEEMLEYIEKIMKN